MKKIDKDRFFDINLIYDIIDGETDEATAAEFRTHVEECPECGRLYNEAVAIRKVMSADAKPSDGFTERTMAKIRAAKKPVIIRIMNSPVFKMAAAAAACLVIAAFIFRGDLFGKLNSEDLTDEIAVTDAINEGGTGTEEPAPLMFTAIPGEDTPENNDITFGDDRAVPESEAEIAEIIEEEVTVEELEEFAVEAESVEAEETFSEEDIVSITGTYTSEFNEEEAAEEELEAAMVEPESVEAESFAEEETVSVTTAYTDEGGSDEILYEVPVEEPQFPEATVSVAPTISAETTSEAYFPETNEEKTAVTSANMPETDSLYFSVPDSDTETVIHTVSRLLAADELDMGKYFKIILIPYDPNEELDWQGITENYPGQFVFVNRVSHDGKFYEAYEYAAGETDYALFLFASKALEVLPPVTYNSTTYLILSQSIR